MKNFKILCLILFLFSCGKKKDDNGNKDIETVRLCPKGQFSIAGKECKAHKSCADNGIKKAGTKTADAVCNSQQEKEAIQLAESKAASRKKHVIKL